MGGSQLPSSRSLGTVTFTAAMRLWSSVPSGVVDGLHG
jgi:hypothetical protein